MNLSKTSGTIKIIRNSEKISPKAAKTLTSAPIAARGLVFGKNRKPSIFKYLFIILLETDRN
jgi:hypothetical protein